MSKRTYYILFLLCLFFSGCKKADSVSNEIHLEKTGNQLTLPVDTQTSNFFEDYSFYNQNNSDNSFFLNLNDRTNTLYIYNLKSEKEVKKVVFDYEGDDGYGNLSGFYFHNVDSVFMFSRSGYKMHLTDTGKTYHTIFDYAADDRYVDAVVSGSLNNSMPFVYQDNIYFKTFYGGNFSALSTDIISSLKIGYAFDLKTNNAVVLPFTYPESYWDDGKKHFEFSMTNNDSDMVVSFYGDHSLYVYNLNDGQLDVKPAKSNYFSNGFAKYPIGGTREERLAYFTKFQRYGSVLYDPYSNFLYRITYPTLNGDYDPEMLRGYIRFPKKFSIQIFDENYEMVGETLFENNKEYVPANIFVGEEGLYISTSNPDNPSFNENEITFELFELSNM